MKTNKPIISILTSAAAFVLLLAVTSAAALTNHAPANATAPAATTTAQTALTPAATAASSAFSTGEDIRDIRQPRHVPSPWFRVLVAAGVVTLLAAAVAAWWWLRHKRNIKLLPHEIALQHLEMARHLMHPEHAREYCFAASRIIRNYVEEQLQLHAPRLTTEEFLRDLVGDQGKIAGAQRVLLCKILQHCDFAKFAGWRYSQESLTDMHASAIEFVLQSSAAHKTPAVANPLASVPENNRANTISVNTNIPGNAI